MMTFRRQGFGNYGLLGAPGREGFLEAWGLFGLLRFWERGHV